MPLDTAEDLIHVHIYPTREQLGAAAAAAVTAEIERLLRTQSRMRIVFAAAPSQTEMLAVLKDAALDWTRIDAFHMDEYLHLPASAEQRFGNWLKRHFFDLVPLGSVHLLDPGTDAVQAAAKYAELLNEAPIDIVCCGIGSNGHLAFNDPPANFNDPLTVKVVDLDEMCRQQQVDDRCFNALEQVPAQALTLTIPTLLSARALFCSVPGELKRAAVTATLRGPLTPECPASILRQHPHCELFLDLESAADLQPLGR
ncbi:MAG: 6-phosphogluconolactonase [Acidobacteriaceae bacterium]|nr:6-phosphogluconolactonase [Acidobacteriaceae bacterium]